MPIMWGVKSHPSIEVCLYSAKQNRDETWIYPFLLSCRELSSMYYVISWGQLGHQNYNTCHWYHISPAASIATEIYCCKGMTDVLCLNNCTFCFSSYSLHSFYPIHILYHIPADSKIICVAKTLNWVLDWSRTKQSCSRKQGKEDICDF